MKLRSVMTLLCGLLTLGAVQAADFVNLTPMPKEMTQGSGSYTLPAGMRVNAAGLPADMAAEVTNFVDALNAATGLGAQAVTSGTYNVDVKQDKALPAEGYQLTVTPTGVTVKAANATGLFYAFQTIKKVLPANVMAGVKAEGTYSLPEMTITDEPRYEYRGFMLDVARHFFTVDEVKRMLDVMSYYKLNRFHWHLTEDQGWRIEMPQYPLLQTVGATAPNSRFTDMWSKTQYWINQPYGPYFYTQDELRDVVAYAKKLHIEVIPEVDMPGHMAAVAAAYPELSCYPDRKFEVWSDGGISSAEVLNVTNPQTIKFLQDVIDTLVDIFPYENIHLGGDECPTSAWEANADCQQFYKEQGFTSYHQIQSWFTKQMGDYAASKGRKISVWNETITATGADVAQVKEIDPVVYCWYPPNPAAEKATQNGLKSVYTCWGPYYINRTQSPLDPPGAGTQSDDVRATYNTAPFPTLANPDNEYCYGIQGTFWTEHVSDREYMEYLALPRLIAIAENAWTPNAKRNFDNFIKRVDKDTELLKLRGYQYSTYYLSDNGGSGETTKVSPDPNKWYRLVSNCSDTNRSGKCVELMTSGDNAGKLWQGTQASEGDGNYDYQWFRFVENPAAEGHYAMVCKGKPNGSVNSTPTAQANAGRWTYNESGLDYGFTLDYDFYAETAAGSGVYQYAIASDHLQSGYYMNFAAAGQSFSINCYNNPADGNSGIITFQPQGGAESVVYAPFTAMQLGKFYSLTNLGEAFGGATVADSEGATLLGHSTDVWASTAWEAVSVKAEDNNSQTVTLRNAATGRYISGLNAHSARTGKTVKMGTEAAQVNIYRTPDTAEGTMTVTVNGAMIWPMPVNAPTAPGAISSGSTTADAAAAPAQLGTAWRVEQVQPVTYVCKDAKGTSLGSFVRTVALNATEQTWDSFDLCPVIMNHTIKSAAVSGTTVNCVYERNAVSVTYHCTDATGALAADVEVQGKVGETYTVKVPAIEFFTVVSANPAEGTALTLDADKTVNVVVSTEAHSGVKRVVADVTEAAGLVDGHTYLLKDLDPRYTDRQYFRLAPANGQGIGGTKVIEGASPYAVWQLEASGTNFAVKNAGNGLYVPAMTNAIVGAMSQTPAPFTFTYRSDWDTASNGTWGWQIKNASNASAWDGNSGGTMAGWSYGQPYGIYLYEIQPMFTVKLVGIDLEGNTVHTSQFYGNAGETFSFLLPVVKDMEVARVSGHEGLDYLKEHTTVTIHYVPKGMGIEEINASMTDGPQGIYDLQGRRLQSIAVPGIYIVNGAKLLVK